MTISCPHGTCLIESAVHLGGSNQEGVAIGLAPLLRPADSRSGGFRGSWRLPRSGGSHGSRAILSRGLSGGSRARFLEGSAWSHSIAHDQCFIREAFAQNRGRCGGVAAKARPHQRRQARPVVLVLKKQNQCVSKHRGLRRHPRLPPYSAPRGGHCPGGCRFRERPSWTE